MKFIDLERQYATIKKDVQLRINEVLDSQTYIMGGSVLELEERLADYCGRKYCLTCASGTDALIIPLMAFDLKKTDAVFVPSFTFFASAESVNLAGGTPVFVDVDEDYNMDSADLSRQIDLVLKEGVLTPRGVITVDLFGRSADYDAISSLAEKYGLFLLEDAAQGFGGRLHGRRNGSFGDVSATSFFPAKPLGCYGDGGAIFTDDDGLYNLMHSIRVHGHGADKYDNVRIGINGRMDSIQAAVVLAKLNVFDRELERRQDVAREYGKRLSSLVVTPSIDSDHYSAWAQYTVRAKDSHARKILMEGLALRGIPTMIYYPIPLHLQTAYKNLGYEGISLPVSERIAGQVFSIPMHPYLHDDEIKMICDSIAELSA